MKVLDSPHHHSDIKEEAGLENGWYESSPPSRGRQQLNNGNHHHVTTSANGQSKAPTDEDEDNNMDITMDDDDVFVPSLEALPSTALMNSEGATVGSHDQQEVFPSRTSPILSTADIDNSSNHDDEDDESRLRSFLESLEYHSHNLNNNHESFMSSSPNSNNNTIDDSISASLSSCSSLLYSTPPSSPAAPTSSSSNGSNGHQVRYRRAAVRRRCLFSRIQNDEGSSSTTTSPASNGSPSTSDESEFSPETTIPKQPKGSKKEKLVSLTQEKLRSYSTDLHSNSDGLRNRVLVESALRKILVDSDVESNQSSPSSSPSRSPTSSPLSSVSYRCVPPSPGSPFPGNIDRNGFSSSPPSSPRKRSSSVCSSSGIGSPAPSASSLMFPFDDETTSTLSDSIKRMKIKHSPSRRSSIVDFDQDFNQNGTGDIGGGLMNSEDMLFHNHHNDEGDGSFKLMARRRNTGDSMSLSMSELASVFRRVRQEAEAEIDQLVNDDQDL